MRHPSVRAVTIVVAVIFALAGLSAAGCLLWVAAEVGEATHVVEHNVASRDLVRALERDLLSHHRTANLMRVSTESGLSERRSKLETRMRRRMADAWSDSKSSQERQLFSDATRRVERYLEERQTADATGRALPEVISSTQPSLEGALSALAGLRDVNKTQVVQAQARAVRSVRAAQVVAIAAATVILTGAIVLILGILAYVVKPLCNLRDTIHRRRSGELDVRAALRGPLEVVDIACAFNEMSDALARQAKDQAIFLAAVAHDIKNPLSVLRTAVHVLQAQSEAEGRAKNMLPLIDRQFDSIGRLVNDMLDASRIHAGQLELRVSEVDLRTAAREIIDLYAPTCPEHQLELHVPDRPVVARADYLRMQQVLANLINNAIKYSPGGGPVDVTVQAEDGAAALTVADRGIGIAPDLIPEIFAPFHRQPSARNTAAGAGLGLSVVRRIVEAHGGSIQVESAPRVGSTFRVRIPLAGAV